MPAKGTRRIPDRKKAEIAIAKELRPSSTDTNRKLANHFDVAEITIAKTSYEKLSDEQKAYYHEILADLKHDALGLTSQTLRKSKELVEKAVTTKDLTGVVAAGKFAHDVYRLETGQATSIVQNQAEMLQSLVNYCKLHANDSKTLAAMVLYAEGSGVDRGLREREAERILVEGENGGTLSS